MNPDDPFQQFLREAHARGEIDDETYASMRAYVPPVLSPHEELAAQLQADREAARRAAVEKAQARVKRLLDGVSIAWFLTILIAFMAMTPPGGMATATGVGGVALAVFWCLSQVAPRFTEALVEILYRWFGTALWAVVCGAAFLHADHPGWAIACGLLAAVVAVVAVLILMS